MSPQVPGRAVAVKGVTSVGDELFLLLKATPVSGFLNCVLFPTINRLAVYSVIGYQPLRHVNFSRDIEFNDMTSCVRHKCLYMSDDYRCIHRYHLASKTISKWPVPCKPVSLSVTSSCNLLVTCRGPNKLVELSADSGQCVREIALQSDIVDPWYAVQLTAGRYVVCHGVIQVYTRSLFRTYIRHELNRVSVVGDDGKVTRSYDGCCQCKVGQLNWPCHLAVDEDSLFIFVADELNLRVVLLSPTLKFVRSVSYTHLTLPTNREV